VQRCQDLRENKSELQTRDGSRYGRPIRKVRASPAAGRQTIQRFPILDLNGPADSISA